MFFNRLKKCFIYNETNINLDKEIKYMKKVLSYALKLKKVKNASFNIIIVDNKRIKELNKTYRNIDKTTDVISFALLDEKLESSYSDVTLLGDIYISIDKAIEQKNEYGHSLTRELCFLAVHGLLHLLGYDHMNLEDEKVMFSLQELILDEKRFKEIKRG